MQAQATIAITTKNRKDDLRNAVASALAQSVPLEVLVIDDGSTDGTMEMVRAEFPSVTLIRDDVSKGLIVQRNRAASLAGTPYIFSIDDDAILQSPRTVEQTLAEFDDPRVGAVAIPFINVRYGPDLIGQPPDDGRAYATHIYTGTAHAVRRELFLSLGGYRAVMFHQGEEGDFCLRLLDAGYVTRAGRADPIHHFESPLRDLSRMHRYGKRNSILFVWWNVPMPYMPLHLGATTLNGLSWGFRNGHGWLGVSGTAAGFGAIVRRAAPRSPVRRSAYRLWHRMRRANHLAMVEIERELAELRTP